MYIFPHLFHIIQPPTTNVWIENPLLYWRPIACYSGLHKTQLLVWTKCSLIAYENSPDGPNWVPVVCSKLSSLEISFQCLAKLLSGKNGTWFSKRRILSFTKKWNQLCVCILHIYCSYTTVYCCIIFWYIAVKMYAFSKIISSYTC